MYEGNTGFYFPLQVNYPPDRSRGTRGNCGPKIGNNLRRYRGNNSAINFNKEGNSRRRERKVESGAVYLCGEVAPQFTRPMYAAPGILGGSGELVGYLVLSPGLEKRDNVLGRESYAGYE